MIKNQNKKLPITVTTNIDFIYYNPFMFLVPQNYIEFFASITYNKAKSGSMVVFYNDKGEQICASAIGEGNQIDSVFTTRTIAQIGILTQAKSVLIIHNHPITNKDNPIDKTKAYQPSELDLEAFQNIQKICSLLNIKIEDFVIISNLKTLSNDNIPIYYSLKKKEYQRITELKEIPCIYIEDMDLQIKNHFLNKDEIIEDMIEDIREGI